MYIVLVYDVSKDENGQKDGHIFSKSAKISDAYSEFCLLKEKYQQFN